jgi:hypothetical protein
MTSTNTAEDGQTQGSGTARRDNLSDVFERLAAQTTRTIAIGEISLALRDRGFGALLVLLALPNLLPMPPGTSTFFGIPMILVALQLLAGYRRPILIRRLRYHEISMESFRAIAGRIRPWLIRFERVAKHRFWPLPQRAAEQLIGIMVLAMGVILILPIPFGNFSPGLAVVLMGPGLGERDGVWTCVGIVIGVLTLAVLGGVAITTGIAIGEMAG